LRECSRVWKSGVIWILYLRKKRKASILYSAGELKGRERAIPSRKGRTGHQKKEISSHTGKIDAGGGEFEIYYGVLLGEVPAKKNSPDLVSRIFIMVGGQGGNR